MSQELKPCPFCGSKDVYLHESRVEGVVICNNCDARGSDSTNSFDPVCPMDLWNSRPSHWVSVKDRLPDNDSFVIAWIGERALTLFYCDDGYWPEHFGGKDYAEFVTHWMPLPEAPEVQS